MSDSRLPWKVLPIGRQRQAQAALLAGILSGYALSVAAAPAFNLVDLVTDDPDAVAAEGLPASAVTDLNLKNPWGISLAPAGPFRISNQNTGTATVYDGSGNPFPMGSPLVVTIPESGTPPAGPTGQVFNSTSDFLLSSGGKTGKGLFFFANLDGSISGWNPSGDPTEAVQVVTPSSSNPGSYTGIAIGSNSAGSFLYAANHLTIRTPNTLARA